jgi:apolipoprotein D and lipocalin family protein
MHRLPPMTTLLLLAALLRPAAAQSPKPTPAPNSAPQTWITGWHQLERITPHAERACLSDAVLLYAPGDKDNSLQIVSACTIKDGNWSYWNHRGNVDPKDPGRFKVMTLWPFSSQYHVLATAPDYSWTVIGSANHRSLWILAKSATLPPDVLANLEATAAAAGFNPTKLTRVPPPPPAASP